MFGIRHGPGTGTLSRLQDLVSELVTHHGDALELWLLPPSRVAEEELVGDEQHDAADLVLIKREVPRVVALQELYVVCGGGGVHVFAIMYFKYCCLYCCRTC